MKILKLLLPLVLFASLSAFGPGKQSGKPNLSFPWQQAGLSKQAAAAHLLSRFTYGYTPAMVDDLVKNGLENWFLQQLDARQNDDSLSNLLKAYEAMGMTNETIANRYADPGKVVKMAVSEGLIQKDEIVKLKDTDKAKYRQQLLVYMNQKGLKPRAELNRQLISQKILRAIYSKNQLQEVMTTFWFNHFNVSLTKVQSASFTLPYERDVIRPNALGNFENLLLATAKSPAMLVYLDNDKSRVDDANATEKQKLRQKRIQEMVNERQEQDSAIQRSDLSGKLKSAAKTQGLNENYAREVMELHTMGVNGGYTQQDVTEGARILTGWMVYPMDGIAKQAMSKLSGKFSAEQLASQGYIHEGDFLFAANRHDYGGKQFLGKNFPAGQGYQEGLALLKTLANHPSTAQFISTKIATRFVQDEPPASLVQKMAETFAKTGGNIKQVLITMVSAPEFWSKQAFREKIKSPFELIISTVRSTGAAVTNPYPLYRWMEKMGEPIYSYQAPTGFPDRGRFWINTGSLLYRMNFGLAFAQGKIDGVDFDAAALANFHEPESNEAALTSFGKLLLPERDLGPTSKRLLPLLNDPLIDQKIANAASKTGLNKTDDQEDEELSVAKQVNSDKRGPLTNAAMRQVIGILLGSPEFQRR